MFALKLQVLMMWMVPSKTTAVDLALGDIMT
jgi:hypothetical protein